MTTIFFADFDGKGPGFTGPVFDSWSIGGSPIAAGHWKLFNPEYPGCENLSPGSGRYAGVHSQSSEFIDTLVWMISPLIDARKYKTLVLSADLYFRSSGAQVGEDKVTISILLAGKKPKTIDVIGDDKSAQDAPISQNMLWDISFANKSIIQVAFSWYSSMGPPEYDSIQLDNILLTGRRTWRLFPFCR